MSDPTPTPHSPEAEKSRSGAIRLLDHLVPKLKEAFAKASIAAGGERVLWEAFPIVAPNPMQPGAITTGLAILFSIPSSVIGQHLAMTPIIEPQFVDADQDTVDEFVRDRFNEMLGARRQQIAQAAAAGNGHQASPGGLVLPGQG